MITRPKAVGIFVLISFVSLFSGCGNSASLISPPITPEQRAIQQRYDKAKTCLTEHQSQEAIDLLTAKDGNEAITAYKNSEVLYNYALAMQEFDNQPPGKREMVDYYLDKIPDDYSGDMAEDIKIYKSVHMHDNDRYYQKHHMNPIEKRHDSIPIIKPVDTRGQ